MSRLLIMIRAYNMLRKHWVTKVQVLTSCSSNSGCTDQPYMAQVMPLQSRTSLLIWLERKKPLWHYGALPQPTHKHSPLRFCHSTYTPHTSTMSDDKDKLPSGVNDYWCKGDSILHKKEEKRTLKTGLPVAPRDVRTQTRRDSFLRQGLLITALERFTIWFNNKTL